MAIRKKLGEMLIDAGAIDEFQLKAALAHQRQWGGRIGKILVELKFADEAAICDALGRQLGMPSIRLVDLDPRIVRLVPQELCEKHGLVAYVLFPAERGQDKLQVAMGDPSNLAVIDELTFRTGKTIEVAVAPDSQIEAAIRRVFYGESVADQAPKRDNLAGVQWSGQEVDLDAAGGPEVDPLSSFFDGPPAVGARAVAGDPLDELLGSHAGPGPSGAQPAARPLGSSCGAGAPGRKGCTPEGRSGPACEGSGAGEDRFPCSIPGSSTDIFGSSPELASGDPAELLPERTEDIAAARRALFSRGGFDPGNAPEELGEADLLPGRGAHAGAA